MRSTLIKIITLCVLFFMIAMVGIPPNRVESSTIPTDKFMNTWKALFLIYENIDADYTDSSGAPQHLKYTMPPTEISDGTAAFRRYAALAHDLSNNEAFIIYDIIYVNRPLNSVTLMGNNLWWISPNDSHEELDLYAPTGQYDSILVLWPQTDFGTGQYIPSGGWGLAIPATSWSNGATYATVANAPTWMWNSPSIGEPWLHEWLHGVCDFFEVQGYPMPVGNADGGGSHGYIWDPNKGWANYYHDLMTGNVTEEEQLKGITAEAWQSGSILGYSAQIFADYFRYNTISNYDSVGNISWDSSNESVKIEGVPGDDSLMYAPVSFQQKFTATGRVYVPISGVGPYDSIALALRNGSIEYWGTLAYGTALVERNHIFISRNDIAGNLYPLIISSGWYTVKMQVDPSGRQIRMKAWADFSDEPDWQITRTLDPGWIGTGIGYRHAGDATVWVDDLYAVESPTFLYIPLIMKSN